MAVQGLREAVTSILSFHVDNGQFYLCFKFKTVNTECDYKVYYFLLGKYNFYSNKVYLTEFE